MRYDYLFHEEEYDDCEDANEAEGPQKKVSYGLFLRNKAAVITAIYTGNNRLLFTIDTTSYRSICTLPRTGYGVKQLPVYVANIRLCLTIRRLIHR